MPSYQQPNNLMYETQGELNEQDDTMMIDVNDPYNFVSMSNREDQRENREGEDNGPYSALDNLAKGSRSPRRYGSNKPKIQKAESYHKHESLKSNEKGAFRIDDTFDMDD